MNRKKKSKVNVKSLLIKLRHKLNGLSDISLKELLESHKKWFDIDDFDCTYTELLNSNRRAIIDFIMDSDPIFTKDGLVAFIDYHTAK